MLSPQTEIQLIAIVVAVACALPGVFLVLRRVALMSDAISHSILLGIVLAFFLTKNISSPLLILGATLLGVLTVSMTELIIKTKKLKEDASIGLVFPVFFSLGVILISLYASDVHLDTDAVLLGEIAFAPFNRFYNNSIDLGPQALWVMGAILIVNLIFITTFYKELKIATFDPGLAAAFGFAPGIIHYVLMTLVSITAVGAFDAVGSILVVALMIVPAATAYLLTDRLSHMLVLSALLGSLSSVLGYYFAHWLDVSIAGSIATMSGIIFILVLIMAPEKGLLVQLFRKRWNHLDFAAQMLVIHLLQSETAESRETETIVSHMYNHMLWSQEETSEVIAYSLQEGFIKREGETLILTPYGREKAKTVLIRG